MLKKPVALIIIDGYGYNPDSYGDADPRPTPPPSTADGLLSAHPDRRIGRDQHGPYQWADGQLRGRAYDIGAGRIVYQELTRITKAISEGTFFENEALCGAMDNCKQNRGRST